MNRGRRVYLVPRPAFAPLFAAGEAAFFVALLHPHRHNRFDGQLYARALLKLACEMGTDTTTATRWALQRWPGRPARPTVTIEPTAQMQRYQQEITRRVRRIRRNDDDS